MNLTPAQLVWLAIAGACAVANLPFIFWLLKGPQMAVIPAVQTALDEIHASIAALPQKFTDASAAAVNAATAQAAQDAADTANAVQATADAVKAAVGA
jgi:type II secretory pathway component PulM